MFFHLPTVPEVLNKALAEQTTRLSFEIIPPFKGESINGIFEVLDSLVATEPDFINVTHHPEVRVLVAHGGVNIEKRVSKRPGTVGICAALMHRYPRVQPVAHIICMGAGIDRIEDSLIELNYLGIRNILALRGDKPSRTAHFPTTAPNVGAFHGEINSHVHASELVRQVRDLNRGVYLDRDLKHMTPTRFSIGVAGYPEGHGEAESGQADMRHLKEKLACGGEYIITQMFFDNAKFFSFCERCRAAGITVPIVPGIKPIAARKHCETLPKLFSVTIPAALERTLTATTTAEAARTVGIEWCIEQCRELKRRGVPMLHFYTMNRKDNIEKIISRVF